MSADQHREIQSVDLTAGRRLVVRSADVDDVAEVQALYRRLSADDRRRRFFVGHEPSEQTTRHWLTVAERGGLAMLAEVVDPDGSTTTVAEAGYAMLDDGDGELAITVDPSWRGWLGGWLLDVLVRQAAAHGIENLHADVLVENRVMIGLLRHRGYAAVDHPDWNTIRLVISTTGHTPGWPPRHAGRRLLAAASGARWDGEAAAKEAGFDVRTCAGPEERDGECPLLRGDDCPLLDGVDAVVFDLVPSSRQHRALITALGDRELPVVITRPIEGGRATPCLSVAAVIEQVIEQVGDRGRAVGQDVRPLEPAPGTSIV
jgi:GNAT superfamily N-acetyltransferase